MRQKIWTTTEIEKLKRMFYGGTSTREMARELGRSRESVLGQCFRLRSKGELGFHALSVMSETATKARRKTSRPEPSLPSIPPAKD